MGDKKRKTITRIKKVIKLGGSCLNDATSIKKAVPLIKKDSVNTAVVVSALKGITDLLLEAYYVALGQSRDPRGALAAIKKRHDQISRELIPWPHFHQLQLKLQAVFDSLGELLLRIYLNRETSPELKARILSTGERLSAHLLAAALEAEGIRAKVYETDKIGLIASEESGKVRVNLEKFEANFKKVMKEIHASDFVPIFTGFFGVNEKGEVVLFGRNGSDYSAAVLARGFRARVLELYKDVPGILSADPSLIPEAKLIANLLPVEAATFGFYGAKVIHPDFWQPLEGLEIEVLIKAFDSLDSPGTRIHNEAIKTKLEVSPHVGSKINGQIKGFTLKEDLILLKIDHQSPHESSISLLLSELEKALAKRGAQVIVAFPSNQGLEVILSGLSAESVASMANFFKDRPIKIFPVEKYLAMIAAVGHGINQKPSLLSRILKILSQENISPLFFFVSLENPAAILILKNDTALRALQMLHTEFIISKNSAKGIVPKAHLLVG